jgi:acyl-CoA synthetase (AMP-forming)/AMP-acid ligase II
VTADASTPIARIADIVTRWAAETPEREALQYGESRWTWSQLDQRIRHCAGALLAAGLRPGDRVAFLDKNNPACLETTLAASLVGAANAVVNFRLSADEVAYVVNDARARVLFVGAEFLPVVEPVLDKLDSVERVVVVGGDKDEYESWLAAGEPVHEPYDADADECCLQLYTSGTTGFPKGAMLTHRGLIAHTRTAAEAFRIGPDTVNVVAMPLFHVSGTSWALLGMHEGGRTIIVRDVVPDAVLDLIERERGTHAFFVPAVFQMFLALGERVQRALSGLTCLGYGGSPMPLPLLERCLAAFPVDFYQVYGMTEMSGVFSVLGPAEHRDPAHRARLVSAGRPLPGVELRVVDPATAERLPAGAGGEFWVRSTQRMAGYWGNPEATAETIREHGWLRTGDAGYQDEDGYLFIQDRVKDMIISGGENVYPAEVERVLAEHPSVAEVAVIGVPHEKWGETVKAVVVAREGATVDEAELIGFSRDRLAGYKCPTSVDVVHALPRNPTGKVLKRVLRAPYWTGRERQL